jgi:hypothetical protein
LIEEDTRENIRIYLPTKESDDSNKMNNHNDINIQHKRYHDNHNPTLTFIGNNNHSQIDATTNNTKSTNNDDDEDEVSIHQEKTKKPYRTDNSRDDDKNTSHNHVGCFTRHHVPTIETKKHIVPTTPVMFTKTPPIAAL